MEDYKKYKKFVKENSKLVKKYHKGEWRRVEYWTIRPGDIIEISGLDEASALNTRYRYCLANVYDH
jgi:magnesium-transporting ATPase (P-type)